MHISDIIRFMRKKGIPLRDYEVITNPEAAFKKEYPKCLNWEYDKFKKKLDKHMEKQVSKTVNVFYGIYYYTLVEDSYGLIPERKELIEKLVKEIRNRIEKYYKENHKTKETKKKSEEKKKKPDDKQKKPKTQTKEHETKPVVEYPTNPTRTTPTTTMDAYESLQEEITLESFLGLLADFQGSFGESRLANRIIELLKIKPETKEEREELEKLMNKALQQLFAFDKNARRFFINRYEAPVDSIVKHVYNDWKRKLLKVEETEIQSEIEQPKEQKTKEQKYEDFTTILVGDNATSQEVRRIWDKMNSIQEEDPETIRKMRYFIETELEELIRKTASLKEAVKEIYDTEFVEEAAKQICDSWEEQVIEKAKPVVEKPIKEHEEESKEQPIPSFAEMASEHIKFGSELEETKERIIEVSRADDIEDYMRYSDEIIKGKMMELRKFLEMTQKDYPERIEALMRFTEQTFGIVLNNECEIDAFIEMIESELHYYQIQKGLEKGASIEQLTQLSTHNARKIEMEYLGGPIQIKESVLVKEPKYSFDTDRDINVLNEGLPLPEDYGDKYIIGTQFKKSLYKANLKRAEDTKGYKVDFARKDWTYKIHPNQVITVMDEYGNDLGVDSYLLIEIQRELRGITNTDRKNNQI